MPAAWKRLLQINHDITRHFQFDYILFDAIFLAVYIVVLIKQKRFSALKVGGLCSIAMYIIDGIIWHATRVREYVISAPWIKHPTDFMMDISYGIVAFSWVWIAFERRSLQDILFWTTLLFGGWLLVPFASRLFPIRDEPITTIRHMQSQVWVQIAVVAIGYALLFALKYDLKTVLYTFWLGCMLAFMMEFSLFVSKIRPTDVRVLVYETLILTNQGIPYLWVVKDKILPVLAGGIAAHNATESKC